MRLHTISVDDRERAGSRDSDPGWWTSALSASGAPAKVERLPVGDYRWVVEPDTGDWWLVVVERKTISDLLGSAEDGRLTRFIEETGGLEPPPTQIRAVLVEGDQFTPRSGGMRQWSADAVDNLLISLQQAGVLVIHSPGLAASPGRLVDFWRYTGKDEHRSLMRVLLPQPEGAYIDPQERAQVRMLMGLPGWGEERAKSALRAFGSVSDVLHNLEDPKAWKDVAGIGPGLVKKANEFISGG